MDKGETEKRLVLTFGHRGAAGHLPENTLASIAHAINLGADWVEIDVRRVEDELVVIHDDTLDRTTSGEGPLSEVTLAELRSLDAGGGEKIPLLSEVLDLIDARVGLNIELKDVDIGERVIEIVSACVKVNHRWRDRLLLSSFDADQTELLAEIGGPFRLGILSKRHSHRALEWAARLDAYSFHTSRKNVDRGLIAAAQAVGIKVYVYTVNNPSEIEAMLKLGVDGLFSDYPDRVVRMTK